MVLAQWHVKLLASMRSPADGMIGFRRPGLFVFQVPGTIHSRFSSRSVLLPLVLQEMFKHVAKQTHGFLKMLFILLI